MRIDITAHPAEDIVMDLAGVRELQAENARLNTDRATMQTHIRELQAQLEEARKLPVALLPEITDDILKECRAEWYKDEYGGSDGEQGRAATTVLRRHFREAAEARTKPTLDVEAVATAIERRAWSPPMVNWSVAIREVLPQYVADAPTQPANPALDVEAVVEDALKNLKDTSRIRDAFESALRKHVTDTETLQKMQQFAPADETLAAAVARVERETRAKCAAMVREWGQTPFTPRSYELLADHMERGE